MHSDRKHGLAAAIWPGPIACTALVIGVASAALGGCAVNSSMLGSQQAVSRSSHDVVTGSLAPSRQPKVVTELEPLGDGETKIAAPQPAAKRSSAKIALILPMTGPGPTAAIAKAMKQAAELALFDQSDTDLQLLVKDDQGTPEGARLAAEEAIRDGAELILGPLLSASVQAVGPVAKAAKVPVIAFSNDRQAAGSGVFLLSFMAEQEVDRIIGYASGQGRRNFAALLPDDTYGRLLEGAFTRAVARAGANVITIERYQNSGTGMLAPTRRLAEAMARSGDAGGTADALFLPAGPETLTSLGPLLSYAKLDTSRIKLLGTGGWDGPNIGRDPTFVGAWFPAPDQHGWTAFAEKYGKTYGSNPTRIASLAFDGVGVALALASGQPGQRYSSDGLTRTSGFNGADGQVKFLSDGTAARSLAIMEVQAIGATVLEPAAGAAQPPARAAAAQPGTPVARVN